VIGADVEIGEGLHSLPQVVIYRDVKIGKNFLRHSHVSVREKLRDWRQCAAAQWRRHRLDGFGFAKDENGNWYKIPQTGGFD
jgi:UDP-3-O-[3-hydroxymyristoyl] glucosamine N-acyltransferase